VKKIFLLIFLYCQLPTVNCQPDNYWQQQTDYTIAVSLNDIEHTLDGFEKIKYTNNSPDTLSFIWFHLWPNAYKNDQTAFSEQLLQNGRTDFYFSDKEKKGYINRLDFRIDGTEAKMEDHPLYIDIIKVLLPHPLAPGNQIEITTPFHEKLPFNFSRGGHIGQSYQITQWYPKPAVYDQKGWHEMPYLDQGEFYSEFGNFDVRITIPENYIVAATGELQNEEEKNWLINKSKSKEQETSFKAQEIQTIKKKKYFLKTKKEIEKLNPEQNIQIINPTTAKTKTLVYKQNNIHDFAWFADKNFIVNYDTLQLSSGRIINVYSFYLLSENNHWKNSIQFIKDAVRFRSALIGEYPYQTVNAVQTKTGFNDGMEYPTITSISPVKDEKELDFIIEHEVGHNWFYGILGSNERRYPWMDEGINTYYDKRYEEAKYKGQDIRAKNSKTDNSWLKNKQADDREKMFINVLTKEKIDQPISTSSEDFNEINYNLIPYTKTGLWMKQLEDYLGKKMFDSCMHQYFINWQFKHPYPENFKTVIEEISGKNVDAQFSLLDKKGSLPGFDQHKKIKPTFLFSQKNTDKISYINFSPAAGYNMYDKFMIGAAIHNINLPPENFQFIAIPLYATNSRQFSGIGEAGYSWYPDNKFEKIEITASGSKFSTLSGIDSNANKIFGGFYKIAPALRFTFKNKTPRSTLEKWIEFKTFIIGEKSFNYFFKSSDSNYYPAKQNYVTRYLNQLTYNIDDYRVLYPYHIQLQLQQASDWYRVNFTTNYFFNYAKGGGMSVRFFAAKFGYIGSGAGKQLETSSYQPKLTANNGSEDYTYSNYFLGRTEFDGFASQQVMIKDGGLKIRVDQFDYVTGRSQNWVAAVNLNSSLPASIIPPKIPLKIFFDIGSYSEAWGSLPQTGKFLYVGGLQFSLLKNIINIYAPFIYSSDFSSVLKTLGKDNTFGKRISFSIDIQNINFKKIFRNTPF
jgi:peptidase M1-like protein